MSGLTVVIATSGRPRLLERTLASFSACGRPASYRGILVVENGPKHGAEAVAAAFESSLEARYLHVAAANKSHALNRALESLEDGLLLFTDDDVRVHPSTLGAYAGAADGRTSGALYGGPIGVDYDREPPDWLKPFLPGSAKGWSFGQHVRTLSPSDPTLFFGANWAAFSADVRRIGGFDGRFGPGSAIGGRGQEHDAQSRLLQSGCERIYLPDAMVWHYVPASRCTPGWALRRTYASGISRGFRAAARRRSGAPDTPAKTAAQICCPRGIRRRAFFVAFGILNRMGFLRGWLAEGRDASPGRM